MLDAIRWSTPHLAYQAGAIQSALAGVLSSFPEDAKKGPRELHERIAEPFVAGLKKAGALSLAGGWKQGAKTEVHLLKLGEQLFWVQSEDLGKGRREVAIHAPVEKLPEKGDEAPKAWIRIVRSGLGEPELSWSKGEESAPKDYALALWDAITSAVTSAHRLAERADRADRADRAEAEPSSKTGVVRAPGGILEALLKPRGKARLDTGESGPLTGTDLLFADAWRERPLVITSKGDHSAPVGVWIKLDGGWREIPWPDQDGIPFRGASAYLDGNELHVLGGLDGDQQLLGAHWVYDLAAGWNGTPRFGAEAWANDRAPPLSEPTAWPLALRYKRQTFVTSGIAKFYLAEGERNKRPVPRTKLETSDRRGWQPLSDLPNEVTGGSVLAEERGFLLGPGNAMNGQAFFIDAEEGYACFSLPALPGAYGRGQVHRDGELYVYSGGYKQTAAGLEENKSVFVLDPDAVPSRWKEAGKSDYASGGSRLIKTDRGYLAVMISPEDRRIYHLDG